MPSNLERAWQHLRSAFAHVAYISARTLAMLMDALAKLQALLCCEYARIGSAL